MAKFMMHSGHLIDIENFSENDVILEDIAHNLAKIQRYNGSTPINISYSVGEHCINLAQAFLDDGSYIRKLALLHDATEAYLSDIVGPIKNSLPDYKNLECRVQYIIERRFDLNAHGVALKNGYMKDVNEYDKLIVLDEVEAIMPEKLAEYKKELPTDYKKLGCHISYNNHPSTVKTCFMTMAKKLRVE